MPAMLGRSRQMKVKNDVHLRSMMNRSLDSLKIIVENMEQKRGSLFLRWVEDQKNYLLWEEGFDPTYLKKYKRGEVVLVQFGFNVGSEHGGLHWAVIVDDNYRSNPNALVVPLGSINQEKDKERLHRSEVFLGTIPSINSQFVYAIPHQVRVISKLRIYRPRKESQKSHFLNPDQMRMLERKLFAAMFPFYTEGFEQVAATHEREQVDNDLQ